MVNVGFFTPVEVAVKVTVPVLAAPVLAAIIRLKLLSVVPEVAEAVIQLSFGVII